MPNQISAHDKFFKSTMLHPQAAKEFLQNYLPDNIKKIVNLETLKIQKDSFIDQQYKNHFIDLLYSAEIGNTLKFTQ